MSNDSPKGSCKQRSYPHGHCALSGVSCRHGGGRLTSRLAMASRLSGVNEPSMIHLHDDFAAPAAALRPPASRGMK